MNLVFARNTTTGKVVKVPENYLGHPVLGKNLLPAKKGDKDYIPELYSPKSGEEFAAKSRKKEPEVTAKPADDKAEVE